MGDLARVLVQERVLSVEGVSRAQQAARNGDLASAALDLRLADEASLVRALARAYECPGVELGRSVIPSVYLGAVAPDQCAAHRVLPVSIGKAEIVLAMAEPEDLAAADEVRFLTGKKVLRCVAVGSALQRALDGLVRARQNGAPAWRGERAPALQDPTAAHAALVKPSARPGAVDARDAAPPMELVSVAEFMAPQVQGGGPPPAAARAPQQPYGAPAPYGAPQPGYQPAPQYGAPAPSPYAQPGAPAYAPQSPYAPAPAPPVYAPAPYGAPPAAPYAPQGPAGYPPQAPGGDQGRATVRLEGMAVGKVALIADDDDSVRQLVATVLRKMGCLVLQAADGKTALELVRDAHPDMVVLDAMMPGMHGFEVCRAVKGDRLLRSTRVVLCSALYRGSVGTDAQVAYGADAFIEKPFRLDELMRVFKVALVGPVAAESPEERAAREEAQTLWRAASAELAAGRAQQAAQLAHDAATKDPWSAEAHYYLGHALARQNMLLEAVAAYERSAELRPDVDATHQCLAQAYERLGFQKSARESWARAIETCKDPARKKVMQQRLMALLGG